MSLMIPVYPVADVLPHPSPPDGKSTEAPAYSDNNVDKVVQ